MTPTSKQAGDGQDDVCPNCGKDLALNSLTDKSFCPYCGYKSPPKDRDSLYAIVDTFGTDAVVAYTTGNKESDYKIAKEKALAAIRHLSTKEMLDKLPEKKELAPNGLSERIGYNQALDDVRAALTREEPQQ